MKNYITVTDKPVCIRSLHKALGYKHKLPADFVFRGELELFARGQFGAESQGTFTVIVIRANRQGVPRIFVKNGVKWTPAGRTAQAKKVN